VVPDALVVPEAQGWQKLELLDAESGLNLPGRHSAQDAAASKEYDPGAQSMQEARSVDGCFPASQGMHASALVEPVEGLT
jgi:hypothetical protein